MSVDWVNAVIAWVMWASLLSLVPMSVLSLLDLVVLVKQRSALVVWSLALKVLLLVLVVAWILLGIVPDAPVSRHLGQLMPLIVFSILAVLAGLSFIVLDCKVFRKQWHNRTGWHGI